MGGIITPIDTGEIPLLELRVSALEGQIFAIQADLLGLAALVRALSPSQRGGGAAESFAHSLSDFVHSVFGRILGLFRHLTLAGFRSLLSKLWAEFLHLKDLLRRIFGPIICVIQAIIDYENTIFNIYLRPLIDLLQRVRVTLLLFRLLHVKWAATLDARLARLEGQIAAVGLATLRELNVLRNYLNLLTGQLGTAIAGQFINAAQLTVGALWALIKGVGERPLFASEREHQERDRALFRYNLFESTTAEIRAGGDDPYRRELEDGIVSELENITGFAG